MAATGGIVKAIYFEEHGGTEKLLVGDRPVPEPGPGEVRVRLRTAALNHLDLFVLGGMPGVPINLPHIGGADGAGVVVSTPYMDEAVRCSRLGFMVGGRFLTTGTPRELLAPLAGRILELRADPKGLAHQVCQADPQVEDVAGFGELLHLRLREEGAAVMLAQPQEETQERLLRALAGAGVRVHSLRAIAPTLEDVFIRTLQRAAEEAPRG